jgi:Tfp pilus assembly protein PilN
MIYLKTSVGIELRSEDMLMSSIQSNFSGNVFTHFKRITNYRSREKEDLRGEVTLFFKSHGLSKDNVVLGIPRKEMILRYLDLPAEIADNLKQVVRYQVQSFEPTEEDKFYYDFTLLGNSGTNKRLSVLLVMARKALLDEHLQFLQGLGIRPSAVTGCSMALCNLFLNNRKDLQGKTFVLADLSPQKAELVALHNGAFVYSREVLKREDQNWNDLVLSEINEAASTIRLDPEASLERIALAGESSEDAHEEIKTAVPECELIGRSLQLSFSEETRGHVQEASASIGLAFTGMLRRPLIQMNLLPERYRVHQTRWAYIPTAILGLAVVGLLLALGFNQMVHDRKLIRELDAQILALKAPVDRVQALRNQTEEMEKRIKSLDDVLSKRDMNLEILRELADVLPPDTYLASYTYREGTVMLSGLSGSASDLIPKLEKSPVLKDVIQRGSIFKDQQAGKDRFNYEAKLER